MLTLTSEFSNDILTNLKEIEEVVRRDGYQLGIRRNRYWGYCRKEKNLFFPISILYILIGLERWLTEEENSVLDHLKTMLLEEVPSYQKECDPDFYNFYSVKPLDPFPNGYFFNHFWKFALPCDSDDTALTYYVSGYAKDKVVKFKQELERRTKSTGENAYITWLGTEKMPVEKSIPVICNVLSLFQKHDLLHDELALSSLNLVIDFIRDERLIDFPFEYSIHYPQDAVVAYHMARIGGLLKGQIRKSFIDQVVELGRLKSDFFDIILLKNVLLSVDAKANFIPQKTQGVLRSSPFFIASMMSYAPYQWMRKLAKNKFFHINYVSPTLNQVLWIQYLVLSNRLEK